MDYRQVTVISGKGRAPDRFVEAVRGVSVDRAVLLHVAGDREVKVFDVAGKLQRRWATSQPGYCVANDADGTVWVGQAGQVEQFDGIGTLLNRWGDGDRLGVVTAVGIWVDSILLADATNRCIRRYDRRGQWLSDIGHNNNTKGFLIPNGHLDFCVDGGGIIHAANPAKHRVERYTLSGELVGSFGRFGMQRPEDFPGCCNPTNLALAPQGQLVVTEKAAPRLKVYDRHEKLVSVVASDTFDPNCKNMDVAVDSGGRVYVVDTVRLHVCVFAPADETAGPASRPCDSQGAPAS